MESKKYALSTGSNRVNMINKLLGNNFYLTLNNFSFGNFRTPAGFSGSVFLLVSKGKEIKSRYYVLVYN